MNDEEKYSFDKKMFQHMSSSHSQFHPSSSSPNDQDELIARRKLEQKRWFQQKPGNTNTDVDTLMQSMFTDLKLKPKPTTQVSLETKTSVLQISELTNNSVGHHSQSAQIQTPVSGAADWSKIAFDNELNTIFHQEEKLANIPSNNTQQPSTVHHSVEQSSRFVYPSWCSQSIALLPLVYQQVLEASCVSHIIQTSVLYPILLLSGLRQDQLSQIWSQVNLTQPGTLVKEELFMTLALIGLAQNSNGQIYTIDQLYHLTELPVPHFQIQQGQKSHPPPPPPPPVADYKQEDFADFTSFSSFDQSEQNNDCVLLDLDENHLYPPSINQISSETQSIGSLDLPIPNFPSSNQDDTSQKGMGDTISFSSLNNNETTAAADTQSLHSITSSDPSKLELTQFSFFSDDTSEFDSHTTIWLRCFEKCHSILSQANEIFSSIESPTLCMEVLQQTRTRDYVYHLQEIFHLHKRIYTAAILEPTTTTVQLTSIWKQIVVLWTNLQSFFSTAHLHLLNDDEIDYSPLLSSDASSYCSICLLSTVGSDTVLPASSSSSFNMACLTFAGRLYHSSCANFYLNLIDGILPSLRRLS